MQQLLKISLKDFSTRLTFLLLKTKTKHLTVRKTMKIASRNLRNLSGFGNKISSNFYIFHK